MIEDKGVLKLDLNEKCDRRQEEKKTEQKETVEDVECIE